VTFPLPDPGFAGARPFWDAAARGELVIPRCAACRAFVWYPRERCPGCAGAELPWESVSGRGTLFSFTVVRHVFAPPFAPLVPYATGLVALAEDPAVRLATLLVDGDPESLRVDQPVRVVFRPLPFPGEPAVVAPLFAPA
jgi:uncharacterized OB-fold protein